VARTVLVLDDNVVVRNVVREVLRREGYSVLEARNYEEALALCESLGGEQIDALVVDHGLPHASGRALAEQIVKSCPDLKVLVISGWPFHMVQAQGGVLPGASFLAKPFSAATLAAAVNDMFSARLQ
jgi:CheY-like chemotaxis protein